MRYAATMTGDRTIMEDGVQEALLRYFIARTGGQHFENPRTWLFRVLRNYVIDCNRRLKSAHMVNLEAADQIPDSRRAADITCQQNEGLRCALSSLSYREHECIQLRLDGFSYDEIAHILQIRPGTVGALLTRAFGKIRKTGILSEETTNKEAGIDSLIMPSRHPSSIKAI